MQKHQPALPATISLLAFILACSIGNKYHDPPKVICLNENYPSRLEQEMKSLSSCVCESAFCAGSCNGQTVFERRLVAPACNGIGMVYDAKGNELFTTVNSGEYKKYRTEVKGLREIWRCSKTMTAN